MHDSAQHVTAAHGSIPDGPMAFRVPEVAAQIGLTTRQVYRLISAGELTTVRIGASRRVLRADLQAFLEARRELTPAQVA